MREERMYNGIEYVSTGNTGANAFICRTLKARFSTEKELFAAIDKAAAKGTAEQAKNVLAEMGYKKVNIEVKHGDIDGGYTVYHVTAFVADGKVPICDHAGLVNSRESSKHLAGVEPFSYLGLNYESPCTCTTVSTENGDNSNGDFFGAVSGAYAD